MLDKHLLINVSALPNADNVVLWGDYRVTIITDELFRIERSENKKFRDNPTQTVWFRDFGAVKYSVKITDDGIIITTKKVSVVIKRNREDCYVEINGKAVAAVNSQNLKGTYSTLDCCDGKKLIKFPWMTVQHKEITDEIQLENGVCSRNGVAVLDDSSLSFDENGKISDCKADGSDEYIFAYGNSYKRAVSDFYKLTGSVPLIPRFALGNWWSRYHVYTDKEYLRIIDGFARRKVPFTVATIDMDWHYSSEKDIYEKFGAKITDDKSIIGDCVSNLGWTGYTWNEDLFPDYRKFLKEIEKRNLKITLNVHPSDGVRYWETQYRKMAELTDVDYNAKKAVKFDITDDKFVNAYFSVLHKPYEKDGVSFWWIDWQQGHKTKIENLTPLWALNHYHFLDNAKDNDSPLILSRYSGAGSHRYPLGFSGDTMISWQTLKYLPEFTATASNVGYSWWSHDIGGHMFGEKDDELYVRMVQFGVFSPINRLHCCDYEVITKEPAYYVNGAGLIAEEYLRLRHKMIPYLYTADRNNHVDGTALIEPLYYYDSSEKAYKFNNEYYFGRDLLVSPIVEKSSKYGLASVKTLIPKGKWTDIFTGEAYDGGRNGKIKTLYRTLDNIPVLAREGAVIPFSGDEGNDVKNPQILDIKAYKGNNKYTLYEDGKVENKQGEFFTKFTMRNKKQGEYSEQKLTVKSVGEKSVIPENRIMRINFVNINDGQIEYTVDGERREAEELYIDGTGLQIVFEPYKKIEIVVKYKEPDKRDKLLKQIQSVLTVYEYNNSDKFNFYTSVVKCNDVKEIVKIIKGSFLPGVIKKKIFEIM